MKQKTGAENIQNVHSEEAHQINAIKPEVLDFQTLQMLNNSDDFSQSICGDLKVNRLFLIYFLYFIIYIFTMINYFYKYRKKNY